MGDASGISIFHLTMKFPTPEGVGHVHDQQRAREWYERSLEESEKKNSCNLVESNERKVIKPIFRGDEDTEDLDP